MTYAGCSFEAILNQIMYHLGYNWEYAAERPTLTTQGFQGKLLVISRESNPVTSRALLIIVGRPYARICEARKSALLNVSLCFSDILSYKIGDLHFVEYIIRCSQTWR